MRRTRRNAKPPVFEMYTLNQLNELFEGVYSPRYLMDLWLGIQPIRPLARKKFVEVLGKTEQELFGEERHDRTNEAHRPRSTAQSR